GLLDAGLLARRAAAQPAEAPAAVRAWHLRHAVECAEAGHAFAAVWHLDRLLADSPGSGALLVRRARAHFRQRRWAEAARDFRAAERCGEGGEALWRASGWANAQIGNTDAALADFARARQALPEAFDRLRIGKGRGDD